MAKPESRIEPATNTTGSSHHTRRLASGVEAGGDMPCDQARNPVSHG